jgi:hypothetical protein
VVYLADQVDNVAMIYTLEGKLLTGNIYVGRTKELRVDKYVRVH